MSSTPETQVRRRVAYRSINDIRNDLHPLISQPTFTVGQWSFGQILEHLTKTTNASFDGFGFKAPWWARTFIAPFIKRRFLTKPMPAGFTLPKSAAIITPADRVEISAAVDEFIWALQRLERDIPRAEHPFFGPMKPEEWLQLHLRHAELHLSFVVPE
ncbi:MAG: DUF1569 domain-containing protein [Planctomycetaceae bacterium]